MALICSPARMSLMSVGFRLKSPEEIHAQLEKMSDAELIEHGKTLRSLCRPTKGQGIDKGWLMQLKRKRVRSGDEDIRRGAARNTEGSLTQKILTGAKAAAKAVEVTLVKGNAFADSVFTLNELRSHQHHSGLQGGLMG